MPWIPHWYVVRGRHLDSEQFNDLVTYVRTHGRVGHWGITPRTTVLEDGSMIEGLIYYEAGEWRYWTMGEPLTECVILNRENIDRVGIRWADKGRQGVLFE